MANHQKIDVEEERAPKLIEYGDGAISNADIASNSAQRFLAAIQEKDTSSLSRHSDSTGTPAKVTSKSTTWKKSKPSFQSVFFVLFFLLSVLSLSKDFRDEVGYLSKDVLLQVAPVTWNEWVEALDPQLSRNKKSAHDKLLADESRIHQFENRDLIHGYTYEQLGEEKAPRELFYYTNRLATPLDRSSKDSLHFFKKALPLLLKVEGEYPNMETLLKLQLSLNGDNSNPQNYYIIHNAAVLEETIGTTYCYLGNFQKAIPHLRSSSLLFHRLQGKFQSYWADERIAKCQFMMGEYKNSLDFFNEYLEKLKHSNDRYETVYLQHHANLWIGKCWYELGDFNKAKAALEKAMEADDKSNSTGLLSSEIEDANYLLRQMERSHSKIKPPTE